MESIEEYKRTRQLLFDKEGIRPQSKIVDTDGPVGKVHYLELGKGNPLIMIHGGGSHAGEWINIMKPLAEFYHLYVVDRPGHGLTDSYNYRGTDMKQHSTDFIGSFMDAVGLEKAILLGHSMGGFFSLCFSLQCPGRVDQLVLLGAPAGMNRWVPPMLRLLGTKGVNWLLTKTMARPSLSGMKSIYKQLLVAHPEKLSEEYYRHSYWGQKLPGYVEGFTTLLENVLTLRGWKKELYLGDQLYRLKMPVSIIWGEKDAFEKPDTGREKASRIPNFKFETIASAGHAVWLDQPKKCVSLTLSMLEIQAYANKSTGVKFVQ